MTDSSSSMKGGHQLGTPIAIILAGGLIAVAVYFGGVGSPSPTPQAPAQGGAVATPVATPVVEPNARPVSDSDHIRGATSPKVTLIEYSDLECPFCKRFHPTLQQVMTEYGDDVQWVYRHFPLEQIHPNARQAALASECADDEGKFWEFIDVLFEEASTSADLELDKLTAYAQSVGVTNIAAFTACVESEKYADVVDADIEDAANAGGRGTPYTVIIAADGTQTAISGAQPYAAVKAAIESAL